MTKRKKNRLTPKQRAYVDSIIKDPLNSIDHVRAIYGTKTDNSAYVQNCRLKKNKKVQDEINLYLEKLRGVKIMKAEDIKKHLTKLATSSKKDADQIRATEVLAKIEKLTKEGDNTVNLYNIPKDKVQ